MPAAPPDTVLTDRAGIQRVLGKAGLDKRINISRTTVVSTAEEEQVTHAIDVATGRILSYLANRYSVDQLAGDYLVYWYASVFAAADVCRFQAGFVPAAIQALEDQIEARLEKISCGQDRLQHLVGIQGAGVALDNMRLDPRFRYKQLRRERSISDGHQTQKSPVVEDLTNIYLFERNA